MDFFSELLESQDRRRLSGVLPQGRIVPENLEELLVPYDPSEHVDEELLPVRPKRWVQLIGLRQSPLRVGLAPSEIVDTS